jgi:hypothetical protein
VDEAALVGSDPETSIAVPEKFVGIDNAVGEQAIAVGRIPNRMGYEPVSCKLQESSPLTPTSTCPSSVRVRSPTRIPGVS